MQSSSGAAVEIEPHEDAACRAARHLFDAWHELLIAPPDPNPSSEWRRHRARLEGVLTRDEVRGRLSAGARRVLDDYGPDVPRCRCGVRLVGEQERQQRLCTDCRLDFLADAEADARMEELHDVD